MNDKDSIEEDRPTDTLELFFDLVFVFAMSHAGPTGRLSDPAR